MSEIERFGYHNAIIESAVIKRKHGFLILFMSFVRDDGFHQALGGHILYNDHKGDHGYCGRTIHKLLSVARGNDTQDIIGNAVRIYANDRRVTRIGHILYDDWLDLNTIDKDNEEV